MEGTGPDFILLEQQKNNQNKNNWSIIEWTGKDTASTSTLI